MPATPATGLRFDSQDLLQTLDGMDGDALDTLDFGVIHFDADGIVRRYNHYERAYTGLRLETVLGRHVFTHVAQCMNNFMVAERFAETRAQGQPLDETIDYVLTWRMKPTPVHLRMLQAAHAGEAYIVIKRID